MSTPGTVYVGMSGFSYKQWRGHFYPEKLRPEEMLAFYATRFGAVEINSTFRQTPRETTLTRWREVVPERFRFTLKAHQRITHARKLHHVSEPVDEFVRASGALGDRLGAILFQTPPALTYDPGRIERFCGLLPRVAPYAFEPRHPSFSDGGFGRTLERYGIAFGLNDEFAEPASYRVTASLAYFRLRRPDYTPEGLRKLCDVVTSIADRGADAYVFFKHDDEPEAIERALGFQELVGPSATASSG